MNNTNFKNVSMFGVQINPLTMPQTVEIINGWLTEKNKLCHFVVTPNVDHIVNLQTHKGLQKAYKHASLIVTDGNPVVWASKVLGVDIPETVPGSDLVPAIFDFMQQNNKIVTVFLLGAMPGVAERAKDIIQAKWPKVHVLGTLSPDFGFDQKPQACQLICDTINASGADLLVLGLGSPKQELWITEYGSKISCKVALCVGATIDFLAGEKARAPKWMQQLGLEWLHRMFSEPKRLAMRYVTGAIIFPKLVLKEWITRKNNTKTNRSNNA